MHFTELAFLRFVVDVRRELQRQSFKEKRLESQRLLKAKARLAEEANQKTPKTDDAKSKE